MLFKNEKPEVLLIITIEAKMYKYFLQLCEENSIYQENESEKHLFFIHFDCHLLQVLLLAEEIKFLI